MPRAEDLELFGLTLPPADLDALLSVDAEGWLREIPQLRAYYAQFGDKLPAELPRQLDQLEQRLRRG